MILEPGWYLDGTGEPFKVWPGGGVSWYANEGDKGLPLPGNPIPLVPDVPKDPKPDYSGLTDEELFDLGERYVLRAKVHLAAARTIAEKAQTVLAESHARLAAITALVDEQRPFNPHLAADIRAILQEPWAPPGDDWPIRNTFAYRNPEG